MRDRITGLMQSFPGDLNVVEGDHALFGLLMLLVSLARNQYDVSCLGFMNRQFDGAATVGLQRIADASALQPGQRVVHDGDRVLAARIVAGEHDEIAAATGSFAHERPLGAIAVATATEHGNDSTRPAALMQEVMRHRCEVANGVVRVSVVNDYGERLTEIEPLKTPRHMGNLIGSFGNGVRLHVARVGSGGRGYQVVHIHPAQERTPDGNLSLRCHQLEADPAATDLQLFGMEIASFDAVGNDLVMMLAKFHEALPVFVFDVDHD